MALFSKRWTRWLAWTTAVVVVGSAGYYIGRQKVWPAIKASRLATLNREAAAYLAKGDYSNALLTARKSLQSNNQTVQAWEVAAAAAKARQNPSAVYYQQNLCRVAPTKENYLELIRLALQFEVYNYGQDAIKAVASQARNDPEYHQLAAQVLLKTGQRVAAKYQLLALTELRPNDGAAQLDLAAIELAEDPTRQDQGLREHVRTLAADPALRTRAVSLLLRENLTAKQVAGTADLLQQLRLSPTLDIAGQLLVIETLFFLHAPDAETELSRIQKEAGTHPEEVTRVMDFFNRTGLADRVQPWYISLPAETRRAEEVQHSAAEALLVLHDYAGMEAQLRSESWKELEFMREALLAYAYRAQGRSADFAEAWRLAVIGAGTDVRKANLLLSRVDEWKWVPERFAVIWKLFALIPGNVQLQGALIQWERRQGNTANLNRLFGKIVEVNSTDLVAQNNLAYTDLLLDSNLSRAGLIAAELARRDPKNPFVVTTYAFSLYKQGHPAEALARLETLTASQKSSPERMLFRAVFLAALGKPEDSSAVLTDVVMSNLLPEERKLGESTIQEIAKLDRSQGNRTRLRAFRNAELAQQSAPAWLSLLSADVRTKATTDMQLADSLYAAGDWNGFYDLLRAGNWKGEEYLRSALLAYALRVRGDKSGSDNQWDLALATADRDPLRVKNLQALATQWGWAPERLETLNLLFERKPTDRVLLAELLHYYRDAGRTPDLVRVLGLYISGTPETTDEAVTHAYYSMLLDSNLAYAHVVARNAFEVAPGDPMRRLVYVFSLWKQHRAAEAMPLLAPVKAGEDTGVVPLELVRATIQAQLGVGEAARISLAEFKTTSALPEEVALAAKLSEQIAAQLAPPAAPRT